jgi:hypothetical protein
MDSRLCIIKGRKVSKFTFISAVCSLTISIFLKSYIAVNLIAWFSIPPIFRASSAMGISSGSLSCKLAMETKAHECMISCTTGALIA